MILSNIWKKCSKPATSVSNNLVAYRFSNNTMNQNQSTNLLSSIIQQYQMTPHHETLWLLKLALPHYAQFANRQDDPLGSLKHAESSIPRNARGQTSRPQHNISSEFAATCDLHLGVHLKWVCQFHALLMQSLLLFLGCLTSI